MYYLNRKHIRKTIVDLWKKHYLEILMIYDELVNDQNITGSYKL